MRSIQNLESYRDDKKKALSCVALKKEGSKRRVSSLRFLPPSPAAARPTLEGKISKTRKDPCSQITNPQPTMNREGPDTASIDPANRRSSNHGPDQQLQMNTRLHNLSPFCRNGFQVETLLAHKQTKSHSPKPCLKEGVNVARIVERMRSSETIPRLTSGAKLNRTSHTSTANQGSSLAYGPPRLAMNHSTFSIL
ncbi:hypothetical protein QYF36_002320 [Acer negundo]|nr:hypothetical protein QYF36_002320 [Acer negundo]